MYVVLEGIDTSGKSTQIELLKKEFKDAVFTKEPGGTPIGAKIRDILLNDLLKSHKAEMFLFLADRAEHYKEVIEPNLHKLVISDRGFVSGIAYAMSNHKEIDIKEMIALNRLSLDGKFPDLIFLFEMDEDTIIDRLKRKDKDSIEKRGIEYLLDVQNNMKIVLKEIGIRYITIDASKSIEQIHSTIVRNIK